MEASVSSEHGVTVQTMTTMTSIVEVEAYILLVASLAL
jgi:hypothetical protein